MRKARRSSSRALVASASRPIARRRFNVGRRSTGGTAKAALGTAVLAVAGAGGGYYASRNMEALQPDAEGMDKRLPIGGILAVGGGIAVWKGGGLVRAAGIVSAFAGVGILAGVYADYAEAKAAGAGDAAPEEAPEAPPTLAEAAA